MLTSRTPASPTLSIQNQACVDMCKGRHCLVPGSCSGNTQSSPLRAKRARWAAGGGKRLTDLVAEREVTPTS